MDSCTELSRTVTNKLNRRPKSLDFFQNIDMCVCVEGEMIMLLMKRRKKKVKRAHPEISCYPNQTIIFSCLVIGFKTPLVLDLVGTSSYFFMRACGLLFFFISTVIL
jgi:hypothetical protein